METTSTSSAQVSIRFASVCVRSLGGVARGVMRPLVALASTAPLWPARPRRRLPVSAPLRRPAVHRLGRHGGRHDGVVFGIGCPSYSVALVFFTASPAAPWAAWPSRRPRRPSPSSPRRRFCASWAAVRRDLVPRERLSQGEGDGDPAICMLFCQSPWPLGAARMIFLRRRPCSLHVPQCVCSPPPARPVAGAHRTMRLLPIVPRYAADGAAITNARRMDHVRLCIGARPGSSR